jgi:hypothetical protein
VDVEKFTLVVYQGLNARITEKFHPIKGTVVSNHLVCGALGAQGNFQIVYMT